jgi:2-haloacid dehalogenase
VDREAAELVASRCGVTDPAAIARLAAAERRLRPWDDTVDGLDAFAGRWPIAGLSNASRATLAALNAHAGLRWHFVLSAQDAGAYKPAAAIYRLPTDLLGYAPERVLLVAAHAWDLRGAQAVGLRTAYVPRLHGDPPRADDAFDHTADSLAELLRAIG